MKALKYNLHSIYTEFLLIIVTAFVVAAAIYAGLSNGMLLAMDNFFVNSSFEETMTAKKMDQLQEDVTAEEIKSNDKKTLKAWLKKNKVTDLLVIKDGTIRYDSSNMISNLTNEESLKDYYEDGGFKTIKFADGKADVFTFGISVNQYYDYAIVFSLIVAFFSFFFVVFHGIHRTMSYIKVLNN